ncbi:hypothetical protein QQS21_000198 [Conoideocrella luteorostrata]|uniref:Peptidase S8/S53 domain-containing protein n=1 Tax=Conoideocrella luteorostrata TaxID=1105319 RepID=A0AAJ0G2W8_9HYPO|nr:hypothetical protein QQS21_000198 [Conoideocrella luteorostrata]
MRFMFVILFILPTIFGMNACENKALSQHLRYPEKKTYIVGFKDSTSVEQQDQLVSKLRAKINFKFIKTFAGIVVKISKEIKKMFEESGLVEWIQENIFTPLSELEFPEFEVPEISFKRSQQLESRQPTATIGAGEYDSSDVESTIKIRSYMEKWQNEAPWGLARLSHAKTNQKAYHYHGSAGRDTCVVVIDSGIDAKNPEFGDRARFLKTFSRGLNDVVSGHGTQLASIIGGKTYGVAKRTKIYSIKVTNDMYCGVEHLKVIKAMEYIIDVAPTLKCSKGITVLLPQGDFNSISFQKAASSLADAGIFVVIPAGNRGIEAERITAAIDPRVCIVGATDRNDRLWKWSNYGKHVDILAPGVEIQTLDSRVKRLGVKKASKVIVGSSTSLAAAHVAGLGAYLLGLGKSPKTLCNYIVNNGIENTIDYSESKDSRQETPNVLANNGFLE